MKFLLLVTIFFFVSCAPTSCNFQKTNVLENENDCKQNQCFVSCPENDSFVSYGLGNNLLFGNETLRKEAYQKVCVERIYSTLTKHQKDILLEKGLKEFRYLVSKELLEKNEKIAKKIFNEALEIYPSVVFRSADIKSSGEIYHILGGREYVTFYLKKLKKEIEKEEIFKYIEIILDSIRYEYSLIVAHSKYSFGNNLFGKVMTTTKLYSAIGNDKWPRYIQNISIYEYLESLFSIWHEFERYCSNNGKSARDISVNVFKSFIQDLKSKYPLYPFKRHPTFKPFKKGSEDEKAFEKYQEYLILSRSLIENIYQSGLYCNCLEFDFFYMEHFEKNKIDENIRKEYFKKRDELNLSIKNRCSQIKNKREYTNKLTSDILHDKDARDKLNQHLLKNLKSNIGRNDRKDKKYYTSISDEEFNAKKEALKKIENENGFNKY